jgi:hypothetical protein
MDVPEAPPAFDEIEGDPGEEEALPSYTLSNTHHVDGPIARPQCLHTYESTPNGKGKPWFTLEVLSNAASARNTPYFVGRLPMSITGRVRLSLPTLERIISVRVIVCSLPLVAYRGAQCMAQMEGEMQIPTYYRDDVSPDRFFSTEEVLFASGSEHETRKRSFLSNFRSGIKLQGDHVFDFSVKVPATLLLPRYNSDDALEESPFPPTYKIMHRFKVSYRITAEVERPNLSSSSKVGCVVAHAVHGQDSAI